MQDLAKLNLAHPNLPQLPTCVNQHQIIETLKSKQYSLFPLSASKLEHFCSHCIATPSPLNVLTGEIERLGFYYHQRLHHECQIALPETLDWDDWPLLEKRWLLFRMYQGYFQCPSIGVVLCIALYVMNLRRIKTDSQGKG